MDASREASRFNFLLAVTTYSQKYVDEFKRRIRADVEAVKVATDTASIGEIEMKFT